MPRDTVQVEVPKKEKPMRRPDRTVSFGFVYADQIASHRVRSHQVQYSPRLYTALCETCGFESTPRTGTGVQVEIAHHAETVGRPALSNLAAARFFANQAAVAEQPIESESTEAIAAVAEPKKSKKSKK